MGKRGFQPTPLPERWARHYAVNADTGCWEWTGTINNRGYGTTNSGPPDYRSLYAHRVSFEIHHGPIPKGLVVHHRCENRRCVNPEHLGLLTSRQNVLLSSAPHMVAHLLGQCTKGHDVTGDNGYVRPDNGKRMCHECRRQRQRKQPDQADARDVA